MGKKFRNLIGQIAAMPNLYRAFEKAANGKRYSVGYLQFKQYLAANLRLLSAALIDGSYRPSPPTIFYVNEPKRREISALPFADRVVQHALCGITEPLFERTFLPNSYACRRGKGTHLAPLEAQAFMRRGFTHWLKLDFAKYFANVYGHILDRYLTHTLRISAWLRYMDDTVTC